MRRELRFWDMPETTRFILNEEYCNSLFQKSLESDYKELAKELGVSYPYVHHLRRTMYSLTRNILLRLSELSGEDKTIIEKNISQVKTRSGISLRNIFPFQASESLSSLVGHVFGDGTIGKNRRHFEYHNTNPVLLSKVENEVKGIFGIEPFRKTKNKIIYPSIVGDILLFFGAPISPKLSSKNTVPKWILNGNEDYKISFIRSFFDDDGSVMYSKGYNAKGLNLHQTRYESKGSSLNKLLNEVRTMLNEFNVKCGKPLISREYTKADGKRVVMYINITNYDSLTNFFEKISLTEGEKLERLKMALSRRKSIKGGQLMKKPKKVLVLGSGALKIGQAGESL